MKVAIVYTSVHHKNTEKIVKAIVNKHTEITLIDATKTILKDMAAYDIIGFGSGIFYGKLHKSMLNFITENLPAHKKTFVIYTCGQNNPSYKESIEELIKAKDSSLIGCYSCPGYDTWGPFKLIGGKNKNHPNENDIQNAVQFYENLI